MKAPARIDITPGGGRILAIKHKDSSKPPASGKSTTSGEAIKQGRRSHAYGQRGTETSLDAIVFAEDFAPPKATLATRTGYVSDTQEPLCRLPHPRRAYDRAMTRIPRIRWWKATLVLRPTQRAHPPQRVDATSPTTIAAILLRASASSSAADLNGRCSPVQRNCTRSSGTLLA